MPPSEGIEIRPADPSWRDAFVHAADELASVLERDARIEHIGSTAVPGLAAKQIIDVLVGVAHVGEVSNAGRSLIRLSFAPGATSKAGVQSAFFSRPSRGDNPPINAHLTVAGSCEWHDLIRFRTALQNVPGLAARYEVLKRRLAEASGGDLDVYTAGKTAFISEVLEWARG